MLPWYQRLLRWCPRPYLAPSGLWSSLASVFRGVPPLFPPGALRASLDVSWHPGVGLAVLRGSRPSTIRPGRSAGSAFHLGRRIKPYTPFSLPVVYVFLSSMFHYRDRGAPAVSTSAASLADPLRFGFFLELQSWVLAVMRRGFVLRRPPTGGRHVFWCLRTLFVYLQDLSLGRILSLFAASAYALFLVALASGLHASRFSALVCRPAALVFPEDGRQVSLAPSPSFLAMDEMEGLSQAPSSSALGGTIASLIPSDRWQRCVCRWIPLLVGLHPYVRVA